MCLCVRQVAAELEQLKRRHAGMRDVSLRIKAVLGTGGFGTGERVALRRRGGGVLGVDTAGLGACQGSIRAGIIKHWS